MSIILRVIHILNLILDLKKVLTLRLKLKLDLNQKITSKKSTKKNQFWLQHI